MHFTTALNTAETVGDAHVLMDTLKWLGDAYRSYGEFRLARNCHKRHQELDLARRRRINGDSTSVNGDATFVDGNVPLVNGADLEDAHRREVDVGALHRQASKSEDFAPGRHSVNGDATGGRREVDGKRGVAPLDEDLQYWLERSKTRLEKVNWEQGRTFVSQTEIRDAIVSAKSDRYGELPVPYVRLSEWGKPPGTY